MGNRSSIKITQPWATESIYLYTHWEGHRICELLANGIRIAEWSGRTDDPSYATRIIFDELTECSHTQTGFAISIGRPDDEEYDIPEVSWTAASHRMVITYKTVHYSPSEFLERFTPATSESK